MHDRKHEAVREGAFRALLLSHQVITQNPIHNVLSLVMTECRAQTARRHEHPS